MPEEESELREGGIFPAVEGEFQAPGIHREIGEAGREMKCAYCKAADHLETSCPTKASDRRFEVLLGVFFFVFMLPFYAGGFLIGIFWSAFKSGFDFTDGMWPQTWKALRGKKKEDGESGSV